MKSPKYSEVIKQFIFGNQYLQSINIKPIKLLPYVRLMNADGYNIKYEKIRAMYNKFKLLL